MPDPKPGFAKKPPPKELDKISQHNTTVKLKNTILKNVLVGLFSCGTFSTWGLSRSACAMFWASVTSSSFCNPSTTNQHTIPPVIKKSIRKKNKNKKLNLQDLLVLLVLFIKIKRAYYSFYLLFAQINRKVFP